MKRSVQNILLGSVFCLSLGYSSIASAGCGLSIGTYDPPPYHLPFFSLLTFDVGSAASRLISTAVKYFLGDDTELVAELVWKDGSGGCGGCYQEGKSCTAETQEVTDEGSEEGEKINLAAYFEDITVEETAYPHHSGGTIGTSCVAYLAQERIDECVVDQASVQLLSERAWTIRYQSQRRSIQALTDALNMKRIYANLRDIATKITDDYSNYSTSVSTVASKRILLDQLLALKKRVVAARVRVRAQTMELNSVDLKLVTTSPDLTMICKQ